MSGSATFLALLGALLLGCGVESSGPSEPPDILLVTFDTLRADRVDAEGRGVRTAPGLRRLAESGVEFLDAYAPSATTSPSHATLFTGLSPLAHGVLRNGTELDSSLWTLPQALSDRGYRTAAFVSSPVLVRRAGFALGFDHYDDEGLTEEGRPAVEGQYGTVSARSIGRRADQTIDRALSWFRGANEQDGPLFLWVHLMDPHEPYLPPASTGDPFGAADLAARSLEQVVAYYDTEVLTADRALERLHEGLSEVGASRNRLTVVTADHGEEFMEHGWRSHGLHLYQESIRVPLILHWPSRLGAGRQLAERVSLRDVAPTILGLVGGARGWQERQPAKELGASSGMDLSPLAKGEALESVLGERSLYFVRRSYGDGGRVEPVSLKEFGDLVFGEGATVRGHQFALLRGRWKYIEAAEEKPSRELYDLQQDPGERINLAGARPDLAQTFSEQLGKWVAGEMIERVTAPEIDADTRKMLEQMGYLDAVPDADTRDRSR
jgi:choline-sulfatase